MDSGWPVEVPRAQVHVGLGRRRHRRMTVPAGVLLFVCLFLPAVKGCGSQPVYPVELPYFWHPYAYGAILAFTALATTQRAVRRATIVMRVLAIGVLVASVVLTLLTFELGIVLLGVAAVLLGVIGTTGVSERRLAGSGIVVSVMSLLWFGLWCGSSEAMVGVYVSLGASIFLLAGTLHWLSEI